MKRIFKFVKLLHKFQQIKRMVFVNGEERNENDLEHSFQLAMLAWYVNDSLKAQLNEQKIIKYSLVHDLVETYAGDTFTYTKDKYLKVSKKTRENKSLKRIKKEFPEFKNLYKTIITYELQKDKESKFVYAMDKIIPVLNIYLDNGRSWKRDGVSYEMIRTKDKKILISKEANKIWKQLVPLLDKKKGALFPQK